jgi:hypothetical protein
MHIAGPNPFNQAIPKGRILQSSSKVLSPSRINQGPTLAPIMQNTGYENVRHHFSRPGHDRAVSDVSLWDARKAHRPAAKIRT